MMKSSPSDMDLHKGVIFQKKPTLLQHPTDQVPYNTHYKAAKAKSKKNYATDNQ